MSHFHINPSQLPKRVLCISLFIEKAPIAINQHPELRAPVAEVIVGDHRVAEEAQQPRDGVADDRAAQMADVQRLGDVRAAVVDDESLRLRRKRHAEAIVGGHVANLGRNPLIFQTQVDESGASDLRRFEHVIRGQGGDDLLGDFWRFAAKRLGQRHGEIRLVVAVFWVLRLPNGGKIIRRPWPCPGPAG